jgi:PTS system nitrogen regulatory IIA component
MDFASILKPDAVKVASSYSSKKRLFMDLGIAAADVYGLDAQQVTDALLEREALGPTGVGHGVALPHARVDGLESIVSIFLKVEKPSEFSAVDKQPVDLIFCLLAPHQAGVEHLKALALVSRTLRDQDVCNKLRANGEPSTLHAIFTESRGSKAA